MDDAVAVKLAGADGGGVVGVDGGGVVGVEPEPPPPQLAKMNAAPSNGAYESAYESECFILLIW